MKAVKASAEAMERHILQETGDPGAAARYKEWFWMETETNEAFMRKLDALGFPPLDDDWRDAAPTATPWPTATPRPTPTPRPTATPWPTPTPRPTATPLPLVNPALTGYLCAVVHREGIMDYDLCIRDQVERRRAYRDWLEGERARQRLTPTPLPTATSRPTAAPWPTAMPRPTPTSWPTPRPIPTPIPCAYKGYGAMSCEEAWPAGVPVRAAVECWIDAECGGFAFSERVTKLNASEPVLYWAAPDLARRNPTVVDQLGRALQRMAPLLGVEFEETESRSAARLVIRMEEGRGAVRERERAGGRGSPIT